MLHDQCFFALACLNALIFHFDHIFILSHKSVKQVWVMQRVNQVEKCSPTVMIPTSSNSMEGHTVAPVVSSLYTSL